MLISYLGIRTDYSSDTEKKCYKRFIIPVKVYKIFI
jgi:hypothetical protein